MSLVTLRPDSIAVDGSWTVGGGGSLAANLADNSDATYISPPADGIGSTIYINMATTAIPAYAQIRSVTVKIRASGNGDDSTRMSVAAATNSAFATYLSVNETPFAITTRTYGSMPVSPDGTAWTASSLGLLQVRIWAVGAPIMTVFEVYADVEINEAPTVTITSPTGTLTGDQQPAISWVYNDPDGDPQERYQARIFTAHTASGSSFTPESGVPVWSADAFSGDTTVTPDALAANSYITYVRVSDSGSGGRYGPWASHPWTMAGATPAIPILSAAADKTNRRVVLSVQQRDNLLGFSQAGGEITAGAPLGWFADTNCAITTGSTTAAGAEGASVIRMTTAAAGIAKMRSGGQWGTTASAVGQITRDAAAESPRVSVNGGPATTAARTYQAGTVLIASASAGSTNAGTSTGPSISDSSGLAWTLIGTSGASATNDEAIAWVAVVPTTRTATVTLTCADNTFCKSMQIVPYLGADNVTPIGASGTGAAVNAGMSATVGSAARAGAILMASYAEYYCSAVPSPLPGTLYSGGRGGTTAAFLYAAAAGDAGASASVGTNAPTSGVSVTWVYWELLPAVTPPASTVLAALAAVRVQAGEAYTVVGSCWQAANAARNYRIDTEWYDGAGTLLATTAGPTTVTSTGTAMTSSTAPVTAPTNAAAVVLVPVAINPAGAGEVFHWDKMGIMPGSGRWARGGLTGTNMLTADDASQEKTLGTWGSFTCTVARVADAVLTGFVMQLSNGGAGGVFAGHTPVACSPGQVVSAAAHAKASTSTSNPVWISLRFIGADGSTLLWPGSPFVAASTSGWAPITLEGIVAPAGTAQVQLTPTCLAALGPTDWVRFTRLGIFEGGTVPLAWHAGPQCTGYPLVEFSDDGGESWDIVRDSVSYRYVAGIATVYDYEATPGLTRSYRAATAATDYRLASDGAQVVSATSEPVTALLPADGWWLVDPTTPGLMLRVQIAGDLPSTSPVRQTRYDPADRRNAVILWGKPGGEEFSLPIIIRGDAAWSRFRTMRDGGNILLLQGDMGEQWYIALGDRELTLHSSITRRVDPTRTIQVKAIQVDRPAQVEAP